jgi:hypothetical protein
MPDRARLPAIVFLGMVVAACATKPMPTLEPVGGAIPAGVSLEGRWRLSESGEPKPGESRQAMSGELSGIAAPEQSTTRKRKSRRNKEPSSVHVFLETGRDLKVTQTRDGLFFSYDRSIVEEYRFGEHRIINIGPIEADRVSGWEGGRYIVKTLDRQGAILTETWAPEDDGEQLLRTISIVYGEEQLLDVVQRFDRVR